MYIHAQSTCIHVWHKLVSREQWVYYHWIAHVHFIFKIFTGGVTK